MRCINKSVKKRRILAVTVAAFVLCGCGSAGLSRPYSVDGGVSAYRLHSYDEDTVAASFASSFAVTDKDRTEGTDVDMSKAGAAGLFDVGGRDVLYAKNVHATLYPASLTKVLTAVVALRRGNMEDILTASTNVLIEESGAQLCGFQPGDTMTLEQAMHGLLMYSGNDAAVMIAEHIGGSVENFADMMNEEAKRLGATNSHFTNPHGLSDENHYTTAYDMYLIFNEAVKHKEFNEIIQMKEYESTYKDREGEPKEMSFHTTNLFLQGDVDAPANVTVLGGKTGTTKAAGSCLILLSKNAAGSPYISIILKSESRDILYAEMTDLLEEIDK